MTPALVEWLAGTLLNALAAYAALGLLFAAAFVVKGAVQVDSAAQGMPLQVRLLLMPGAAALWPLLLLKWWKRRS